MDAREYSSGVLPPLFCDEVFIKGLRGLRLMWCTDQTIAAGICNAIEVSENVQYINADTHPGGGGPPGPQKPGGGKGMPGGNPGGRPAKPGGGPGIPGGGKFIGAPWNGGAPTAIVSAFRTH